MGICNSVTEREIFIDKIMDFGTRTAATMRRGGNLSLQRDSVPQTYVDQAATVIPADVVVYSGCMDSQTSADVGDVTSFGLPTVSAAQKAGGACTNGLLSVLQKDPQPTFGNVLIEMRSVLKQRGYEQIPQLSTSHQKDMAKEEFTFKKPGGSGRCRAALVGINYTSHSQGQLSGCINDVRMMERMLLSKGYPKDQIRILSDDPSYGQGMPTKDNIISLFKWVIDGARAGDSFFIHYSGHGTYAGQNTSEKDGRDEAIVPLDYNTNGLITDDMLFQMIVAPLPANSQMVCVFDCCHSGTILDLPFIFSATDEGTQALQSGAVSLLGANGQFSFEAALQLIACVAKGLGVFPGAKDSAPADYKKLALSFVQSALAAGNK